MLSGFTLTSSMSCGRHVQMSGWEAFGGGICILGPPVAEADFFYSKENAGRRRIRVSQCRFRNDSNAPTPENRMGWGTRAPRVSSIRQWRRHLEGGGGENGGVAAAHRCELREEDGSGTPKRTMCQLQMRHFIKPQNVWTESASGAFFRKKNETLENNLKKSRPDHSR